MTTANLRIPLLLIALMIYMTEISSAQSIVYTDASHFPLYGKSKEQTSGLYERLPLELQTVCRPPVWYLGRHSAGLYIRFRSNSTSIYAKWESTFNNTMTHMTDTGTKGLDLYILHDGEWRHACSAQPQGKNSERKIIANMDPEFREYMLYLSLYDGVSSLQIGVDEGSVIEQPQVDSPSRKKPIVAYGTSLLQGGCANRPGMAHMNILGRRLDREVINLGFSGNAMLDLEIAELMAAVDDPGMFFLEYVPNASAEDIDKKGEQFFRILRDAHPDVPVIFVEDVIFPYSLFENKVLAEVTKKNISQKNLFEKLKKSGEEQIYYIKAEGMLGGDGEATVDGTHFTDLGAMRYIDHIMPVINKALRKSERVLNRPCKRNAEVLIVGGGAAGISAGIQSARLGAKTVILEGTPWVGGMLTSAGVSCIDGNYKLRGGIFGEFTDSLAAHYGSWDALKTGWVSNINFEPQVGQKILTRIAENCGMNLDIRRETEVLKIKRQGNVWKVKAADSNGRRYRYTAEVLIDATELGDVAKECGVEYRIGMEASSETGESIAPEKGNDIIQDLTYVAILKDYGPDADMTISKPEGYDPEFFANCAVNPLNTVAETGQTIWPAEQMITYGAVPNGKYMINWPIYGNDYYVNSIEMSPSQRKKAYDEAKNFTRCFIYFIQTELGMKHLGIADDVFPTEDGFPYFPYHRESRRIVGEAFLTLDAAAAPHEYHIPYYKTSIAVGDYAVDHHHFRHPEWKKLPDLHFYPIPSFSVPVGVMLPQEVDNLIVTEKSVSVSNLINGATRLQPVVMQLGQAAGAMAAMAVNSSENVKSVDIRDLQQTLLDAGCYIMPYLDLEPQDKHFQSLQRVGASGVMRGVGRNAGWSNETWFRKDEPLMANELFLDEICTDAELSSMSESVTIGELLDFIDKIAQIDVKHEELWLSLGLSDYNSNRTVTRLEAAVVIDRLLDVFTSQKIDFEGRYRYME